MKYLLIIKAAMSMDGKPVNLVFTFAHREEVTRELGSWSGYEWELKRI